MRGQSREAPIDVLPDDVLLTIFDFYVVKMSTLKREIEEWQSLVHVCRRWRCVVFGSPRRLNLQLVCTSGRSTRQTLDIWPALPLVVMGTTSSASLDDLIAALGHSDRVCQIELQINDGLEWDKMLAKMQVPFPALTHLELWSEGGPQPVIPDTFLGGSAPRLRHLTLESIPFSGIPKLLLSCTHLVDLNLHDIPYDFGYFSPEAMDTCLSALTSLNILSLAFESYDGMESRPPPPMTRSVLPSLTTIFFNGVIEYLDDLVARIDAPRLNRLSIAFPGDETNFDTPHLVQFISCIPRVEKPNGVDVILCPRAKTAMFRLLWASDNHGKTCVDISCVQSNTVVSSIARVYTMCLPPLPTVENLKIEISITRKHSFLYWDRDLPVDFDVDNDAWMDLLRPFTAVKSLYLSGVLQPDLAPALRELVGDRTMDVLPSLRNIFLPNFELCQTFKRAIRRFVAARRRSGHPIAVLPSRDL